LMDSRLVVIVWTPRGAHLLGEWQQYVVVVHAICRIWCLLTACSTA
jgi:hypothetical protein